MKKRFSASALISAISAGVLILACVGIALFWGLQSAKKDSTVADGVVLNPLNTAKNGVSMLLRADADSDEVFAANFFPTLNGAKGNGIHDDTEAIRRALDEAAPTGGCVYLPQGTYLVSDSLTIPDGVTLRGDYTAPDAKSENGGNTVILVSDRYTGQSPLFDLGENAALVGLTVVYENQSPTDPQTAPYTVRCTQSCTVRKFAILNADRGILVNGSGTVTLREIRISALSEGICLAKNDGKICAEDVSVSPTYWLNSFPDEFTDGAYETLKQTLLQRCTAWTIGDISDVTLRKITAESAAIGMDVNIPENGERTLLTSQITFTQTDLPLRIVSLPAAGAVWNHSTFRTNGEGDSACVEISASSTEPTVFADCTFSGAAKTVIRGRSSAFSTFYRCAFGTWQSACFDISDATFTAIAPTFRTQNEKAILGQNAFGLLYGAEEIEESEQLLFAVGESEATKSDTVLVDAESPSRKSYTELPICDAASVGILPENEDNTEPIGKALEKLSKTGGILFFPQGTYRFSDTVSVPENVRLIGVGTGGKYETVLLFDRESGGDTPLIDLSRNGSVECLTVTESESSNRTDKTFAIRSLYDGATVSNVTVNAPRGILLSGGSNVTVSDVTLNITDLGAEWNKIENGTFTRFSINGIGDAATCGVRINSGSVTLSLGTLSAVNTGIDLTNAAVKKDLSFGATLIRFDDCALAVNAAQPEKAVITAFAATGNGTLLQFAPKTQGEIVLQGGVCLLNNADRPLLHTVMGEVTLQASIVSGQHGTTSLTDAGATSLIGNIWTVKPTFHASVTEGSATLAANSVESDEVFGGIEGTYILSKKNDTATVHTSANLGKYIAPTESDGSEDGSEAGVE